jgi:hypothetical protein
MSALTPQTGLTEVNVRSHDGEKVQMSYSSSIFESSRGRKSVEFRDAKNVGDA